MSKKETNKVTVEEPSVRNDISMNLTHNDVIDVAIQSQLDILEPQLNELTNQMRNVEKELERLEDDMLNKYVKISHPKVKEFEKVVNAINKTTGYKLEIAFVNKTYGRSGEELKSKAHFYCTHDVENYKNPIAMYKKHTRTEHMYWRFCTNISFQFRASNNNIAVESNTEPVIVNFSNKDCDKLKTNIEKNINLYAELANAKYELYKQILELKYNEKKVKARVVKASLSKTEQGRNILGLLEEATRIKLLS